MKFTAQQLAQVLQGTVEGDPAATVSDFAKIEEGRPGALSFLANPKYTEFIYSTQASIVMVANEFVAERQISATLVRVADPYASFAKLMQMYQQYQQQRQQGQSKTAAIHETAQVGEGVYLGDFVSIGPGAKIGNNVKIFANATIGEKAEVGDNTVIFAGVHVYHEVKIGKNCIVHAGAVIGSDGFGFAPSENGMIKIPQIGTVIIEDDVEVGANTTIDRATMGATIIRQGVKLDNLIQVAHNVEIGKGTVIAAQTGISGSTKIGSNVVCGGQVGFAGHIVVGDQVKIGAQSGLLSNVAGGETRFGSPAFDAGQYKRSSVHFRNLDKIVARLNELEKELARLKQQ